MNVPALLALEDGTLFYGISIGAPGESSGEVVFNTSLTGYQEILSDPSYCRQIVTLTYPHIGNAGVNEEDQESDSIQAAGLVIRALSPIVSNWRGKMSLPEYLNTNNIVAIAEVDTRKLTRLLREKGALKGCIVTGEVDPDAAIAKAKAFPGLVGMDLASQVSTPEQYTWTQGTWSWPDGYKTFQPTQLPWHVVVYDFGVKRNILRMLVDRGCRLTVVPANTPAADVIALEPDGIFLSNGPGDPAACQYAIQAIKELMRTNQPLFGICLGHQLLALSCGANTVKMKFGHHGANHPVYDSILKRVTITSQNHGFAVDPETLPDSLIPISYSLFDQSLQGIKHVKAPILGFQGHPEASPGPHDVQEFFDNFIQLIEQSKSRLEHA